MAGPTATMAAAPGRRGDGAAADPDAAAALARVARMAALLDTRYRIPFTPIRFGADAILGLVPGLGDAAAALPALYILWTARRLGAPPALLARMGANVGLDTLVGSIPLAGSVFDVFFKASRRNHALLHAHLQAQGRLGGSVPQP